MALAVALQRLAAGLPVVCTDFLEPIPGLGFLLIPPMVGRHREWASFYTETYVNKNCISVCMYVCVIHVRMHMYINANCICIWAYCKYTYILQLGLIYF
jgi:hypothetical protein